MLIAVLLTLFWAACIAASAGAAGLRDVMRKERMAERLLTEPFRNLLGRTGVFEQGQLPLARLHVKLAALREGEWSGLQTRRFVAEAVAGGYAALTAGAWLAVLSEEEIVLGLGAVAGLLLPASRLKDIDRKMERRRQEMVLLLPDMLSKLILLVGAGETVQRALSRCMARDASSGSGHPSQAPVLYREWERAMNAMHNGLSFAAAVEQFNRRCAVQEVAVFTTVLLLNYRRGGDQFVLSLRELSVTLWEKRKAAARSRGEEASSKLVFPLVGIFFVMMVIVAAPAVLLMG